MANPENLSSSRLSARDLKEDDSHSVLAVWAYSHSIVAGGFELTS
jgi:hypothetical protein